MQEADVVGVRLVLCLGFGSSVGHFHLLRTLTLALTVQADSRLLLLLLGFEDNYGSSRGSLSRNDFLLSSIIIIALTYVVQIHVESSGRGAPQVLRIGG